jgi:hypothetical protein
MQQKTYYFKKYFSNSEYSEYSDFSESLVNINILPIQSINHTFLDTISQNYSSLFIPKNSLDDLDKLLTSFNLMNYKEDFLSLITIIQSTFLLYNEEYEGALHEDFIKEKKEFENLIKVLEIYLFGSKKELYPISFKFFSKKTQIIKNFFLIDDIYKAILKYYNLDKENFQVRTQEILSEYNNNFNFKKGGDFIKSESIKILFNFLKEKVINISDNKALKFCGILLHICQIPSNNNKNDIMIGDIKDTLVVIDHENLRHYINDRTKFFT